MNEMIADTAVKSRPRAAASAAGKKAAPVTLTGHIVEIVSDSGEGAQRCGQTFGAIASQMGNGVWTVEIIPAEIRPPARSVAGGSGALASGSVFLRGLQDDDSIAIMLVHTPDSDARTITDRVRAMLEGLTVNAGPDAPAVKSVLTLGLASFPTDATTDSALLEKAQTRLAAARQGAPGPPPIA